MLKIRLVKSKIGTKPKQRATLEALGLKRIGQVVEKPDNSMFQGMIYSVRHLVVVDSSQVGK